MSVAKHIVEHIELGIVATPKSATVAIVGDSIARNDYYMGQGLTIGANTIGSFTTYYIENAANTSPCVLAWDGTYLTFAQNGTNYGAQVAAPANGLYFVPGNVTQTGVMIAWYPTTRTYTAGTASMTFTTGSANNVLTTVRGVLTQALALSHQSITLATTTLLGGSDASRPAVYSMPGATTVDLAAAASSWGAITADVFVVVVGTNDSGSSLTYAQSVAAYTTIFNTILGKGSFLMALAIPPKNATAGSPNTYAQDMAKRNALNRWMQEFCASKKNSLFVDVATPVTDTSNGNWLANYSPGGDLVHPSGIGAYAMGLELSAAILRTFSYNDPMLSGFHDVYDSTFNTRGNILPTAGMAVLAGTGGTNGGVNGTGATLTATAIAAGYYAQVYYAANASTPTLTCSQVARTDEPGNWQVLALTGVTDLTGYYFRTINTITVVAGDVYDIYVEVNFPSTLGSNVLADFNFNILPAPTPSSTRDISLFSLVGNPMPSYVAGTTLLLKMSAYKIPAGCTNIMPRFTINAVANFTMGIGRIIVRKT